MTSNLGSDNGRSAKAGGNARATPCRFAGTRRYSSASNFAAADSSSSTSSATASNPSAAIPHPMSPPTALGYSRFDVATTVPTHTSCDRCTSGITATCRTSAHRASRSSAPATSRGIGPASHFRRVALIRPPPLRRRGPRT
jgi:hypothetical protein